MGIDAQLRKETGEVLAEVDDPRMVLSGARSGSLSDTCLLRYLVPWGDTVFDKAQVDDLRDDIHQVIRAHTGTPFADILFKIEPLVDRWSAETRVYLWFVGD